MGDGDWNSSSLVWCRTVPSSCKSGVESGVEFGLGFGVEFTVVFLYFYSRGFKK